MTSSPQNPTDISVVIVSWNTKRYLEMCLQSLVDNAPRRPMEIIVVDNGSADGSPEMVEAQFPHVKLIRSKENLGFAKGNNVAIRESTGRYIALVNSDAVVLPNCLDALADFLDEHPKVGNVGPRVLNGDMTLQVSCRRFPTVWNNFCSATGLASKFRKSAIFTGEQMFFSAHDKTMPVEVLVGCFFIIRREALDAVGLLDETLFMYGDDLDWCRRCWDAGWEVVFYPGAQAIHYGGKSSAAYPVRFAVAQQRSILQYWSKHHGFWGMLGIRSVMVLHHVIRYCAASVSGLIHRQPETSVARKQTSSACLRELFGSVPREA